MEVSFLGGPQPQRGVGVVAPFDFALDRELWRWVPDEVSLHLTTTPYVPVEVSLDLARLVSEHETLREAVRALGAVRPRGRRVRLHIGQLRRRSRRGAGDVSRR